MYGRSHSCECLVLGMFVVLVFVPVRGTFFERVFEFSSWSKVSALHFSQLKLQLSLAENRMLNLTLRGGLASH